MAETFRAVMVNHATLELVISPDDLWRAILNEYVGAGKFRKLGSVEPLHDPSAIYGGYRLRLNQDGNIDEREVRFTERDEAAKRLSAVADYNSVTGGMRVFSTYQAHEAGLGSRFSIDCHVEMGIDALPDELPAKLVQMKAVGDEQLAGYLESVKARLERACRSLNAMPQTNCGSLGR